MAIALSQAISFSLFFSRLEKLLQPLLAGLCSSLHRPLQALLQDVTSLWSCVHQSRSNPTSMELEGRASFLGWMAKPVLMQPLLQLTFAMAALPLRVLLPLLSVPQGPRVLSCQSVLYPSDAPLSPCPV